MKKTYYYAIALIIGFWILSSMFISNDIILPSPFDVLIDLIFILSKLKSWYIIATTLLRVIFASIISFLLALLFATISFYYKSFREFFHVFYIVLKTIPNIAIIIISLIWFGREGSILFIVLLVTFPIMYSSILNGYLCIDKSLILNTNTYEDNYYIKLKRVYIPLIRNNILVSFKNTLSLGLKVTVMSELLSQVNIGIGKELYFYKINLEISEIFAWTIIMIIIATLFDFFLNKLIDIFSI